MENLSFQMNRGCSCQSCVKKARRFHENYDRLQDEAFRVFDTNVIYTMKEGYRLLGDKYDPFSGHAKKRSNERAICLSKIYKSFEDGMPIDISVNKTLGFTHLLILSIVDGRPIHTSLYYYHKAPLLKRIEIATVYRPDSEKWKWDETYTTPIFDCSKEEEFKFEKSLGNRI